MSGSAQTINSDIDRLVSGSSRLTIMTKVSGRSLSDYHRKRNFESTAAPRGEVLRLPGQRYVMHKHAASHLHYDLRLQEQGVWRCWALLKGPGLTRGRRGSDQHPP